MAKRRFYCDDLTTAAAQLDAEQATHARKSLRLAVGDAVELYDGKGAVAQGTIAELGKTMVVAIDSRRTVAAPKPAIDLAVAIPKGPRADALVDGVSQAGADRLIPLVTEWSVVEPGKGKQGRFERIAAESAKQCERAWLMIIETPTKLEDLLGRAGYDSILLADLQDVQQAGFDVQNASTLLRSAQRIAVLVGPEGGWSPRERELATAAGCLPWRFGPHVMRIETAAVAAVAILRSMVGNANHSEQPR